MSRTKKLTLLMRQKARLEVIKRVAKTILQKVAMAEIQIYRLEVIKMAEINHQKEIDCQIIHRVSQQVSL